MRARSLAVIWLCLCFCVNWALAQANRACPQPGPEVTVLGNIYSDAVETLSKTDPQHTFTADGQTKARYFRFAVTPEPWDATGWYLRFSDMNTQRTFAVVGAKPNLSTPDIVTGRIYAPGVQVSAIFAPEASNVRLKVRKLFEMPETSKRTYYSWKDNAKADYLPLFAAGGAALPPPDRAAFKEQASAVAMIIVPAAPDGTWQSSSCTGVMLTGDLLLTNRHCAPRTDGSFDIFRRQMVADLSWDGDPISHEFSSIAVEFSNTEADFMIVRVTQVDGGNIGASGTPARVLATDTAPLDRTLVILHHAESLEKQVSFIGCDIVDWSFIDPGLPDGVAPPLGPRVFSHSCDTEGGASGAPVFARDATGWHVIGLHQAGYTFEPDPANPATCGVDGVNKAIPMYWILKDVERRDPELYNEIKNKGLITGQ